MSSCYFPIIFVLKYLPRVGIVPVLRAQSERQVLNYQQYHACGLNVFFASKRLRETSAGASRSTSASSSALTCATSNFFPAFNRASAHFAASRSAPELGKTTEHCAEIELNYP